MLLFSLTFDFFFWNMIYSRYMVIPSRGIWELVFSGLTVLLGEYRGGDSMPINEWVK